MDANELPRIVGVRSIGLRETVTLYDLDEAAQSSRCKKLQAPVIRPTQGDLRIGPSCRTNAKGDGNRESKPKLAAQFATTTLVTSKKSH